MSLRIAGAVLLTAVTATSAFADQTKIKDYDDARDKVFYRLYAKVRKIEATDIYCGLRFWVDPKVLELEEHEKTGNPAAWLTLEHAYAAQWMANALKCGNRDTCGSHGDDAIRTRFNHAEADLHNLWPAVRNLNSSRQDSLFGMIAGETRRRITVGGKQFECDYEKEGDLVEPRRIVRGNLARSIFYMCHEYGFPIDPTMLSLLKTWNKQDRPTTGERRRNDKIEAIQGTRNPFIDDPATADALQCAVP
jgi:deoxyribonuclease-1